MEKQITCPICGRSGSLAGFKEHLMFSHGFNTGDYQPPVASNGKGAPISGTAMTPGQLTMVDDPESVSVQTNKNQSEPIEQLKQMRKLKL